MKKRYITGVILITVIIVVLCGCPPAPVGEEEGGGGADFDPSLYYTKDEIQDLYLNRTEVEEVFVKKTGLDPAINASMPTRVVGGNGIILTGGTNTNWASGTSFIFPVPDVTPAYEFAIIFVIPQSDEFDADGFWVYAGTSDADKAGIRLPPCSTANDLYGTVGIVPVTNGSRFWLEDMTALVQIKIVPVFFNDWQ